MTQEVLLYHSGMAGAPVASANVLGGLVSILDACLVNGFNTVGVSTLTSSGGIATATTASAHNFIVGDWVDMAGADQSAYNGRVQVLSKPASNQFTYAVTGSPASPATGSMSAKHGPVGWTKTSLGTNTAQYIPGAGLGYAFQVEDNNVYADSNASCRTRIIKDPTALDAGSVLGEICRTSKVSTGWQLIADKKTVYLIMGAQDMLAFGELSSFVTGDQFHFFQTRGQNAASNINYFGGSGLACGRGFPSGAVYSASNTTVADGTCGATILRGYPQTGGYVSASPMVYKAGITVFDSNSSCYVLTQPMPLPNPGDASVPLVPHFMVEYSASNYSLRGKLRGIYHPIGSVPSGGFVNNMYALDPVTIDGAVRKIVLFRMSIGANYQLAVDVGGPW